MADKPQQQQNVSKQRLGNRTERGFIKLKITIESVTIGFVIQLSNEMLIFVTGHEQQIKKFEIK